MIDEEIYQHTKRRKSDENFKLVPTESKDIREENSYCLLPEGYKFSDDRNLKIAVNE